MQVSRQGFMGIGDGLIRVRAGTIHLDHACARLRDCKHAAMVHQGLGMSAQFRQKMCEMERP
jgi:hypothetical protein